MSSIVPLFAAVGLAALVDSPNGIATWDEALPLGNGQAGALVWGTNDTLLVTLDRADFWHNTLAGCYADPGFTWTNFVALCRSGNHDERRRVFGNRDNEPSKLPGVRLEMKLAAGQSLRRFRLDARDGSAHVTVATPSGDRELAAWFEDDSPYLSMNIADGISFASRNFVENKNFARMGFPAPTVRMDDDGCFYSRKNLYHDTRFDLDFAGGVKFAKGRPNSAFWRKFWSEAAVVELPDPDLQRLYDFAIYLYGAGARRGHPPLALQGLWTADNGGMPPWHGDYHNDLNTEMTYWAAGPSGCIEALEGLADFYIERLPEFRAFARKAYGCHDGAVIVPTMSFAGGVIGGWNAYTLPATHGLWVFCTFCDAYDYAPTKEKAAKYLAFGRELAKGMEKCFDVGADGIRRMQISVSPEWKNDDPGAFMKGTTNYERAILNGFYLRLARLAEAIGEKDEAEKWRGYVGSFGPSETTAEGVLKIAPDVELDDSHRHLSHLMEVFPLIDVPRNPKADYVRSVGDFESQGTKWWVGYSFPWTACCDVWTGRGDNALRHLKIFQEAYVTANGFHVNGDQTKSGYGVLTYRPMTLEGNFGFARAIQELLVRYDWNAARPPYQVGECACRNGRAGAPRPPYTLFPSVPAAWKGKKVSFRNLRIPGGRKVSATLLPDGQIVEEKPMTSPEGGLDDDSLAQVTVDFAKTAGTVKPLHGVVGQGPAIQGPGLGLNFPLFKLLKDVGVPFARLHDVGGDYGGNRYVDIPNIFRDFDADPEDPSNYDFAFTDRYLEQLIENGVEPYYRLGVTIETAHDIRAYRIDPPKDFKKWAVICEHVIRHYTEGWANGYKWKIRYWEIWNEPENAIGAANHMWTGSFADYCRLYEVASKHLKAKFPHLKIGGYASCGFYAHATSRTNLNEAQRSRFAYIDRSFEDFLAHVKAKDCPFDFFSFHCYDDPAYARQHIAYARRRLDEMGFAKTELSLNEWLPSAGETGSPKQAANIAAMLCVMQEGGVDNSMLYDAQVGPGRYAPLFDAGSIVSWFPLKEIRIRKAYWALKGFNELYKLGRVVPCSVAGDGVWAIAATDGKKGAVLVANTSDEPRPLDLAFGAAQLTNCRLTDATHDDAPVDRLPVLPPNSFALLTFVR